jgi:hypothetical protein
MSLSCSPFFKGLSIPHMCDSRWFDVLNHTNLFGLQFCVILGIASHKFSEKANHGFFINVTPNFQINKFCVIFVMRSHIFCRTKNHTDYNWNKNNKKIQQIKITQIFISLSPQIFREEKFYAIFVMRPHKFCRCKKSHRLLLKHK